MHKKGESGAVTEDDFEDAISKTQEIEINSVKELSFKVSSISAELADTDDWEKRIDALKTLRGVIKSKSLSKEDYFSSIKTLDLSLQSCVKDLRSQLVREACITIAFLTTEFKTKLESFLDTSIEYLMNLVPNGVKIMSTSGKVALKYIVNNTQSTKLLSYIIKCMMDSKSNNIRQYSSELVKIVCSKWSARSLEKCSASLSEAIKKGISDADECTRANSREIFCWYNMKFSQTAQQLLKSLDVSKQKVLKKELEQFGGETYQAAGDTVDTSAAPKKTFKVPASTITSRTAATSRNLANSTSTQSRLNSARSEASSAANSTEFLYVKPQVPTSASSNFGWRTNTGGRNRIPSARSTTDSKTKKYGKVSQSQPSTREHSPSSKSGVSTYTNGGATTGNYVHSTQGANNNFRGRGQPGYSSLRQKNLANAVTEGLNRHKQTNQGVYDHYQSDDNMSETSSIVSDHFVPFNDFYPSLSSRLWSDRKKALSQLERYMTDCELKPLERKQLIDVFNTMFLENQSAVVKKFLTVLYVFIERYHNHIQDWIYTLLIKLLYVHANDKLKSSKMTVSMILKLLLDKCGAKLVFDSCCKFIVDKSHDPSIRVKLSLLEYMKTILTLAPPHILDKSNQSANLQPTIGQIIMMTTETKSTDLRKMSTVIIVKMFDLNSSQFSEILKEMPNSFQDRATNLLNAYINKSVEQERSQHNKVEDTEEFVRTGRQSTSSKPTTPNPNLPNNNIGGTATLNSQNISEFLRDNTEAINNLSINYQEFDRVSSLSAGAATAAIQSTNYTQRSHKVSPNNTYQRAGMSGGMYHKPNSPYTTQNQPIPHTTTTNTTTPTQRSFIPAPGTTNNNLLASLSNNPTRQISLPTESHVTSPYLTNNNSSNIQLQHHPSNDSNMDSASYYNPEFYNSGPIDTRNIPQSSTKLPPEDVVSEILKELSNYNDRHEERKACLFKLIKMFRENTIRHTDWNEHFKTLLFVLLETMVDNDSDIKAQSLRVLQELARNQSKRFSDFSQLTVVRVLEAHCDTDKNVVKAAEECSRVLTQTLSRDVCLSTLIGAINDDGDGEEEIVVDDDDDDDDGVKHNKPSVPPIQQNQLVLPALKMLTKLIKHYNSNMNIFDKELTNLCCALSKSVNHSESQVRKETILCLVEVYKIIKDDIWNLVTLTASQKRLLDVYIKKHSA